MFRDDLSVLFILMTIRARTGLLSSKTAHMAQTAAMCDGYGQYLHNTIIVDARPYVTSESEAHRDVKSESEAQSTTDHLYFLVYHLIFKGYERSNRSWSFQ